MLGRSDGDRSVAARRSLRMANGATLALLGLYVATIPFWWSSLRAAPFVLAGALLIAGRVARRAGSVLASVPAPPAVDAVLPVGGGPWRISRSPADGVPSHGWSWAQEHALDIGAPHPVEAAFARPERSVVFGSAVLAPVDGTVVLVRDGRRDRRCRNGPVGLAVFLAESLVLSLAGPWRLVGNCVAIRRDDGVHVLLAHLQRDSSTVRAGDRVARGQVVASCGNSGSTTRPHLHVQAMTSLDLGAARGVPLRYEGFEVLEGDRWVPGERDVPAVGDLVRARPASGSGPP